MCSQQRGTTIHELRRRLAELDARQRPAGTQRVSTGCSPLDPLLPEGGIGRGNLVEWLAMPAGWPKVPRSAATGGLGEGSGAGTLALKAAGEACRNGFPLVVVERQRHFYPPAASAGGIDLAQTIVVRVDSLPDEIWALDQALRSRSVGAVLCWSDHLPARALRRLQLAAESSGAIGLLVRPAAVRGEPCWAEARLLVRPCPHKETAASARRLRVEVLHRRGGLKGGALEAVELEVDHETGVVRLAPALASERTARIAGA